MNAPAEIKISRSKQVSDYAAGALTREFPADILVAATLHCMATMRDCPYLEYNATANPLRTDLLTTPIRPKNGSISVPEQPGLGIELREDTLKRFRWQP